MASGLEKMIKEVRYVPYLKRSLLSLGMFDKQGYMIKVDNRTLRINHGSLNIMRGALINGVYVLQGKLVQGTADVVPADQTLLWHNILDHISENNLLN